MIFSFSPKRVALREFILDSLVMLTHDESTSLADLVICELEKFVVPENLKYWQTHDRGVVAFFVWETLNQQNIARSPKEIAYALNIKPRQLSVVEKSLNLAPTFCSPVLYVERLCGFFNIDWFPLLKVIKNGVNSLNFLLHQPEIIVAAVLDQVRLVLKENNQLILVDYPRLPFRAAMQRRQTISSLKNLDTTSIAAMLQITPGSMTTIRKNMTVQCKELLKRELSSLNL